MFNIKNILFACLVCFAVSAADAATLQGTASVNVTSDTSAVAKTMAFNEARRQIIMDALRQYALVEQLSAALASASDADLTNLIAASGIDGEKISDTTYSANISMTVDADAARKWLADNNVQNWLPDGTGGDRFVALITTSDSVADWMELKRIARDEKIDLATKYMMGNQITVELPTSARGAFTIAIREAGWRYSNTDGVLKIWKQ